MTCEIEKISEKVGCWRRNSSTCRRDVHYHLEITNFFTSQIYKSLEISYLAYLAFTTNPIFKFDENCNLNDCKALLKSLSDCPIFHQIKAKQRSSLREFTLNNYLFAALQCQTSIGMLTIEGQCSRAGRYLKERQPA